MWKIETKYYGYPADTITSKYYLIAMIKYFIYKCKNKFKTHGIDIEIDNVLYKRY